MTAKKTTPAPTPPLTAAEQKAADDAAEQKAADDAAEPKRPKLLLCLGRSLTTLRGILSDGDEITAEDLVDGAVAIKKFIKSGHIEKG